MKWIRCSRLHHRLLASSSASRAHRPPRVRTSSYWTRSKGFGNGTASQSRLRSAQSSRNKVIVSMGGVGRAHLPPAQPARLKRIVDKSQADHAHLGVVRSSDLKVMTVSSWKGVPMQCRVSVKLEVVCYACTVCPFVSLNDPSPVYRHTLLEHTGLPHKFHCCCCGHSHDKVSAVHSVVKMIHTPIVTVTITVW